MSARRNTPAAPPPPPIGLLDVVGQSQAVVLLQRMMKTERLPHALLFAGPEGVGRRTTAIALAGTLLCGEVQPVENGSHFADLPQTFPLRKACGVCNDCRTMAAGSHPDFHMVFKELARYHDKPEVRNRVMQELGIEVIRKFLIEPAGRAANRGRGKVFIVQQAELMSSPAQNALLKTLEEPPPGVTIILLAHRPEQLLPTTLSRCATVRFGFLPESFVTGKLTDTGAEEAEAQFWAAFTGGSVGRALRMHQAGLYELKTKLVERLAGLDRGDPDFGDLLLKTMESLANASVKAAKAEHGTDISQSLAKRQAAGMLLNLLCGVFRDAIRISGGANLPLANADQHAVVSALAGRFESSTLAEVIQQLSEHERPLWRNVNLKVIWDNVAITCATAAPLRL